MRFIAFVALCSGFAIPALSAQPTIVFKHIILVIQENRTPDNLFGSNPNFEPHVLISTEGKDSTGKVIQLTPVPLASCYDLDHSHLAFEQGLAQQADMEKVLPQKDCAVPSNPQFKYVDNSTGIVQPYFDIATSYGFANRMFQTNQGPSFPAHQFLFGGTSAPSVESPLFVAENIHPKGTAGCIATANTLVDLIDGNGDETTNAPIYPCFEHRTLSDLLDASGISWRYYSPLPGSIWTAPAAIDHICQPKTINGTLKCRGPAWTNGDVVPHDTTRVLTDIQNCNLAQVTWSIPTRDASDHASNNNGTGPQWVASIVNAVGKAAPCADGENYWQDTAILITWDDWGGWFDHVKPFAVNVQSPGSPAAWGDGYTYGFRVPLLVVSAYTPPGYVGDQVHDFGTILNFIEQNFNLGFIGSGQTAYDNYADYQAAARNDSLGDFFSLTVPRTFVPIATTVPPEYFLHQPPQSQGPDDD